MVLAEEAGDAIKHLTDIPGVGRRVAERLVEFFGSEDEAVRAILECRLSLLAEAVGRATAARIIHGVYKRLYGSWPRDVAATDDAWKLYQQAKEVITSRASGTPGRDVLACMLPVPSSMIEAPRGRLERLRRVAEALVELGDHIDELRVILGRLDWPRPVKPARIQRRLVVIGDEDAYQKALEKLGGFVEVVYARDGFEAEELTRETEAIVYDPHGLYTGQAPRALELEVYEVAPEVVVEYYRVNWSELEAVVEAVEVLRGAPRLLDALGIGEELIDRILEARDAIHALKGGDINPEVDEEYRRLKWALDNLDRVVDEIELMVNNEIQSQLESLELRLTAAQFLRIFRVLREGGEGLELPEEIYEVYERVAEEAEKKLAEKLGLEPEEAEVVKGIVPRQPVYPVELDREKVEELRRLLREKLAARRFEILKRLAEKLHGLRGAVERLVYKLAVLDALLAEYALVREGVATLPDVSREYLGVGFEEALEASLLGRKDAQPVSYVVGDTPYKPDSVKGERVILLTGANSGGKTTLLKTICETALLAQSGLVVYAKRAWVGAFDHIHFFSKPTGMVDAGALETTLRILGEIVAGEKGRRLILVDELEAATEAGAAARIMAVVIEQLCSERDTVAVIVTHLAREILAATRSLPKGCVRIDGIEARGLDENYNLIVDRNPRYYYLARSTPELVVRRLLHRARKPREKMFYERLLDALSTPSLSSRV